jgi:hypothetical protein
MGRISLEKGQQFLETLEKYGVKEIDTAFSYLRSHYCVTL